MFSPAFFEFGINDPLFPIMGSRKTFETVKRIYKIAGALDKLEVEEFDGFHEFNGKKFFQLIEEEARIYNKILVLLPRTEKDASHFPKLVEAVRSSMIFNNVVKSKFQDIEGYYEDKESINSKLRESFPFTQGKYQILDLFQVILKKCNYLPSIYQYHLHYNLEFLKTQLIKNWLPVCLDIILVPIYKKTTKTESISMNAFYFRTITFENLKKAFS